MDALRQRAGDLIRRIETDFRLGGHKAAAIAMVLERASIYLVSDMEPDFVRADLHDAVSLRPEGAGSGLPGDGLRGGRDRDALRRIYAALCDGVKGSDARSRNLLPL